MITLRKGRAPARPTRARLSALDFGEPFIFSDPETSPDLPGDCIYFRSGVGSDSRGALRCLVLPSFEHGWYDDCEVTRIDLDIAWDVSK